MGFLSWLTALLRAWLGIRADIQQRQQEHVGQVVQQNADLTASLAAEEAIARQAANPASDADIDKRLKEGTI